MTVRAELADGRVLEFPDGTDDAVVQSTVKRVLSGGFGDEPQATGTFPMPKRKPPMGENYPLKEPPVRRAISPGFLPMPGEAFDLYPPELTQSAAKGGVVYDRPLDVGHAMAGYAMDPASEARAYDMALQEKLGADEYGALKSRTTEFGGPVRVGPQTGAPEYYDPDSNRYALADPAGIGTRSFEKMVGELLPAGGGAAGAVGGSFASPVLGTAAGAGVGAFSGELARLAIGRNMGVNDASDGALVVAAAKRAGIDVAATLGLPALSAIGRKVLTVIQREPFVGHMDPKAVQDAVRAAQAEAADIAALTGKSFPVTSGQALADVYPELLAAEKHLSKAPEGAPLRAVQEQQRAALDAGREQAERQFGTPPPSQTVGERVQNVAGAGPRAAIGRVTQGTAADRVAAVQAAENTFPDANVVRALDAATDTRTALQIGRQAIRDQFADRYGALGQQYGGVTVDLAPVRRAAAPFAAQLERDFLPSLSAADKPLIEEALRAGKGPPSMLVLPNGTRPAPQNVPADLATVQQVLSNLRDELRLMRKGVSANKNIGAVQELHDALLTARNRALEGNPKLRADMLALEADYGRAKQAVDRDLIGRILYREEGGGFRLRDDRIVNEILSDPRGAERMVALLNDPLYAPFGQGVDAARRGMLARLRDAVVDEQTGIVDPAKHSAFMRRYGTSMKAFFTPAQMDDLSIPARAAGYLKDRERAGEQAIKTLERSFGMKIGEWDSAVVIDRIFNEKRLGDLNRLRVILGRHPDLWRQFQAASARKLFGDITSWSKMAQRGELNLGAILGDALKNEKRELLVRTFGSDYVTNLNRLANGLKIAERASPMSGADAAANLEGRKPGGLWRSLIGAARTFVARPLSRPGVALTNLERLRQAGALDALSRALADPEHLQALIRLQHVAPGSQKAKALLGLLGAEAFHVTSER